MEYIEFSSRTLHLALQPTGSAPKFALGSSSTSQIKINSSKQCQKKTCAIAGMQDASKGIVAGIWKQEMVHLHSDKFAWRIKEVNLCVALYRNIWRIYMNLCKLIWKYIPLGRRYYFMLSRCRSMTSYIENEVKNWWTYGQVVSCAVHSIASVMCPRSCVWTLSLKKVFFFSRSPPDMTWANCWTLVPRHALWCPSSLSPQQHQCRRALLYHIHWRKRYVCPEQDSRPWISARFWG